MDNGYSTMTPGIRVFKQVAAWVALAVLVAVGSAIWSGFQVSLRSVSSSTQSGAAVVATPSTDASSTSVATGTVAVTRVAGVQLHAAGNKGAQVLATVKKGVTLQVLNRTDTWLRVKDPNGHIGWIENLISTIEIRKK
jgi:hypothetical protein